MEGAALALNIGVYFALRPFIWPSVCLANTSSASLIIGVRDVRECPPAFGQLRFHSGILPEKHPNLPEFTGDFQNFSKVWVASPPDPPFDTLLRIFDNISKSLPAC